ncbi:MAG: hypothetical protein JNK14_04420 [Chitinophagaceae bacterium]|nr:hypothetical protein [Chitinophagaceae bacterium]
MKLYYAFAFLVLLSCNGNKNSEVSRLNRVIDSLKKRPSDSIAGKSNEATPYKHEYHEPSLVYAFCQIKFFRRHSRQAELKDILVPDGYGGLKKEQIWIDRPDTLISGQYTSEIKMIANNDDEKYKYLDEVEDDLTSHVSTFGGRPQIVSRKIYPYATYADASKARWEIK